MIVIGNIGFDRAFGGSHIVNGDSVSSALWGGHSDGLYSAGLIAPAYTAEDNYIIRPGHITFPHCPGNR